MAVPEDADYAFFPMPPQPSGATIVRTPDEGRIMALWAWVLLIVGGIGLIGAVAICAALYEMTWMRKFRRWDALP
jgi:hypothetical protein